MLLRHIVQNFQLQVHFYFSGHSVSSCQPLSYSKWTIKVTDGCLFHFRQRIRMWMELCSPPPHKLKEMWYIIARRNPELISVRYWWGTAFALHSVLPCCVSMVRQKSMGSQWKNFIWLWYSLKAVWNPKVEFASKLISF